MLRGVQRDFSSGSGERCKNSSPGDALMRKQEYIEIYYNKDTCVSYPAVLLTDKEIAFSSGDSP